MADRLPSPFLDDLTDAERTDVVTFAAKLVTEAMIHFAKRGYNVSRGSALIERAMGIAIAASIHSRAKNGAIDPQARASDLIERLSQAVHEIVLNNSTPVGSA